MSYDAVVETVGAERADELRRLTLDVYARAEGIARERGIILADTKLEFGSRGDGTTVLADEVLTPDSSRFWPAAEWQPGRAQPSYDKQIVRNWALSPESGWDRVLGRGPAAAAAPRSSSAPGRGTSRPTSCSPAPRSDAPVRRSRASSRCDREPAFDYLVDPRRRPEWQSSLRRVSEVDGEPRVGQTWVDETKPGLKPRMRTTELDRPARWSESGTWRFVRADLTLDLAETAERLLGRLPVPHPRARAASAGRWRSSGPAVARGPAPILLVAA